MKFRTEIDLVPSSTSFDYSARFVFVGSCFSENIGGKLQNAGFEVVINPCGVIFNPHCLAELFELAASGRDLDDDQLLAFEGYYFSPLHHSKFSGADADQVLKSSNESIAKLQEAISCASSVFVTLGTAWVYRHNASRRIVANCNKIPNHQFSKELMSIENITKSLNTIVSSVSALNPKVEIVFTVSPVRHWKDGPIENQRSKSHIIAAMHAACDRFENARYFPSYEIQMDDLRDYRFYKEDLLHPSDEAVNYIWQKFKSYYFKPEVERDCSKLESLHQMRQHRAQNELERNAQVEAFKRKLAGSLETDAARRTLDRFK